jgi:uncharacterized cupredoxin-like copper-binding protein
MHRPVRFVTALAAALVLLAGCGGDDGAGVRDGGEASASGSASGSGSGSGSGVGSGSEAAACSPVGEASSAAETVTVTLDEYAVDVDPASAAAGTVAFELDNAGEEAHEFVVVQAASADSLPTGDDGAVVEDDLEDGAFVGEVEPFPAGETCEGTFELEAGDYVLFCNVVEGDESHFAEGMSTSFTVES